jgi:DnaJ-domain-containing protein 1
MAPLATRRAIRYARRAWPFLLAAYHRWDQLTPQEKERYIRRARETVQRGQKAYNDRRPGGGGRGRGKR